MKTHSGSRRTAMSAVLLLLAMGLTIRVSARVVELGNDVDISPSQHFFVKHQVAGAPRLVADVKNAAELLTVEVTSGSTMNVTTVELTLGVLDPLTLRPISVDSDNMPLTFSCNCDGKTGTQIVLYWHDFFRFNDLNKLPDDVIFTVVGGKIITQDMTLADVTSHVTITLSGPGREILIDRIGDLAELDKHAGRDADDIPVRSMDVVRALAQLEAAPGRNRGVDLEIAGQAGAEVNRFVGFTHTFDLDPLASVQDAMLRFRVTGGDPGSPSDFMLLESAVRNAATGTPVPIVAFCHLPGFAPVSGEAQNLRINLRRVPVVSKYPSPRDPCPSRVATLDLLPDLQDSRLNVIVGDHSTLDFSDLLIFIKR